MQTSLRIATTFIVILMLISGCDLQKQSKTTPGYDSGIAAYQRGHYQIALHDFEARANQGDEIAQFCLAYMLQHGEGVKVPDIKEASKWYEEAVRQNYHPARNNLAILYARYAESAADNSTHREIVELLKAAAQKGYAAAQYNLYIINPKKHVNWLYEAVDRNYVPALNRMFGYLVLVEEDMEKDAIKRGVKDIFERIKKAAEQGDAVSQRNLGYCYEKGLLGVEKDPEKALEWYTKAGDQGDVFANYNAGQFYRTGEGVDTNLDAAIKYYFRAASKDDIPAQNALGVVYERKYKKDQNKTDLEVVYERKYKKDQNKTDLEMATRWYLRAAQQDDAIAQTNIGSFFSEGTDITPQDYSEAYFWYSLALRNEENRIELSKASDPNHLRNTYKDRDELAKILDEKEKTEIDERVEKWKPKQLVKYGTGFYIDEHHILTNAHVVIDSYIDEPYIEFRIPYRRVKYVTHDEESDLALLYDPRENIEQATFRWNEPVESGEKVSVFGYPQSHLLSYEGNITEGIVSNISDMIEVPTQFENRFQHTAPMQQGNSGAPVFDSAGNVIGVNVSLMYALSEHSDDVPSIGTGIPFVFNIAQNINFAIKSDVVQDFLITKNIRSVPFINIQPGRIGVIDDLEDIEVTDDPYTIRLEYLYKEIDKRSVEETLKPVAIPVVEIRKEAKKFTWPIVCFRNKEEPPLKLREIRIKDLVKK